MANYMTITSDKDKGLAFWLCLFGGIIGLHQFYVGNIGKGILYCCTCGLIFGWIFDLIAISTGSFKDASGQPLRANKSQMNQQAGNTTIVNNNVSNADELAKYKKLLDEGAITQEEFDSMKSKILK